ncbi:hypothetical protein AB0878_49025 [Amycolatopsis sp. NPDC047767]|uniref:hypothetical protein n=1 Tax=Amycolatopsis sp. NPDC047767 TaxID=3156765 RepID=UPI0034556491
MSLEMAKRGHCVIGAARIPENLARLPLAERLRLDATDQSSVDAAVATAGEIDVVINNAGEAMRAPLKSMPVSPWRTSAATAQAAAEAGTPLSVADAGELWKFGAPRAPGRETWRW